MTRRRAGPGGTWFSQVTPLTDFPVQNNNQHAMPILAAIRMAGIDATAQGLSIAPPRHSKGSVR